MKELLLEFQSLLDSEDKEKCIEWALSHIRNRKFDIVTLYMQILTPALNATECKDADEFKCIWKEHVKTSIVRTIVESCYPEISSDRTRLGLKPLNRTVLTVCPPDEYHEIGARMVADLFTIVGFKSIFIGGNTPLKAILSALEIEQPAFIAISVSNPYHLSSTIKIITAIRKANIPNLKIIVGGHAFAQNPELFQQIGADKYITSFQEIQQLTEEI